MNLNLFQVAILKAKTNPDTGALLGYSDIVLPSTDVLAADEASAVAVVAAKLENGFDPSSMKAIVRRFT